MSGTLVGVDPSQAWQEWRPSREQPWDRRLAAHLYRRAAFGADWGELESSVQLGHQETLDRLLTGREGASEFYRATDEQARRLVEQPFKNTLELQSIWLHRMLRSPHPLLEKMTLFWHGHFATSYAKVAQVRLMQRQNDLLRHHALGNFGSLLLDISRDPALMVWLDTRQNVKGKPNENFAREIMEAFTLGHGNFGEEDVREAARAFTGWRTVGQDFQVVDSEHDFGRKTVLGRTGPWGGEDVVRILLEQPETAQFVVRKLFRFFITENQEPSPELIEPLADRFRDSDYNIAKLVGVMLRSNLFFSDLAYRQRVKSPIEFVLGMVNHLRTGECNVESSQLARQLDGLGQKLYSPPNVFGWEGGAAWINATTLLERQNLSFEFTMDPFRKDSPVALLAKYGPETPAEKIDFFCALLLDGVIGEECRQKLVHFLEGHTGAAADERQRLREAAHLMMLLPEYQLA